MDGLTLAGWIVGLTAVYLGYRWDMHRATRGGRDDA